MRARIFLIPCLNMGALVKGFFERPDYRKALRVSDDFDFDPDQDLVRDTIGKDPGVWKRAHELLRGYKQSHRHAIVMLDEAFDGSPGAARLEGEIGNRMSSNGWNSRHEVIVLQPELESWIWQDCPEVESAFNYRQTQGTTLRAKLAKESLWDPETPKPADPKACAEWTRKTCRAKNLSYVYNTVARTVPIPPSPDPQFVKLRSTLSGWFPPPPSGVRSPFKRTPKTGRKKP